MFAGFGRSGIVAKALSALRCRLKIVGVTVAIRGLESLSVEVALRANAYEMLTACAHTDADTVSQK